MTNAPSPRCSSGTDELRRAAWAQLNILDHWGASPDGSVNVTPVVFQNAAFTIRKLVDALPLGDAQQPPSPPKELHWLGDRDSADITRHAIDMRGCVMYFDQQSDCLKFMRWLTALPVSSTTEK